MIKGYRIHIRGRARFDIQADNYTYSQGMLINFYLGQDLVLVVGTYNLLSFEVLK